MTSQVNPSNIDGTYPIAGQDNDSQGFRDNFTNIRNNFVYTKTEMEDLQNKAIFKSALNNTTLDNNMGGATISNVGLQGYYESFIDLGTLSGNIIINYASGNVQRITTGGSVSFQFNNWPASGKLGKIKLWFNVSNVAHTITLPSAVTVNTSSLVNYNAGTITLKTTGTYYLEFNSYDGGVTIVVDDITKKYALTDNRTPANVGTVGDTIGMTAFDNSYLYVCTASYTTGNVAIWKRSTLSSY